MKTAAATAEATEKLVLKAAEGGPVGVESSSGTGVTQAIPAEGTQGEGGGVGAAGLFPAAQV